VTEDLTIHSHAGPYTVSFESAPLPDPACWLDRPHHFLVDANVAARYRVRLGPILDHRNTILIEATEANKTIDQITPVIERLIAQRIRRDHALVAIGGGIIQDVCCFVASTLLRGLPWRFLPTTLLAQADSCVGSKSSINVGDAKNIMGTFHPPTHVAIHHGFLDTLAPADLRSGIGEILKVHAIEGLAAFDALAAEYDRLLADRAVLRRFVRDALRIKQRFVEADEFDRGVRIVFNYGHSFGHAIEAATRYAIPHGIAVTIGMDMANHVAVARDLVPRAHRDRMHGVLRRNYEEFARVDIPIEPMLTALTKDKKNTSTMLGLILPTGDDAAIRLVQVAPDDAFRAQCVEFLEELRA
jgi:3-dehydroquinate synthase